MVKEKKKKEQNKNACLNLFLLAFKFTEFCKEMPDRETAEGNPPLVIQSMHAVVKTAMLLVTTCFIVVLPAAELVEHGIGIALCRFSPLRCQYCGKQGMLCR